MNINLFISLLIHVPGFSRRPRTANVLAATLLALAPFMVNGHGAAQAAGPTDSEVTWQISELKVASAGSNETTAEGSLTKDYVLEGKASGGSAELIGDGTVRVTLSAYSPAADSATQKKGRWYVRGSFTLIDARVPGIGGGRYPPGTLTGRIQTELAFDPSNSPNLWLGQVVLPITRFAPFDSAAAPLPIRGEGQFTVVPGRQAGKLSLRLKLWSNPKEKSS
jgi:hypothetical protein